MPRILVLDDDEPLGRTLGEALTDDGHEVRVATTLTVALDLLESAAADLILTNVGRPTVDGLDIDRIHTLRARVPRAKIVIFTGHPQALDLDLDELGVAAVLLKPADLNQLMGVITDALD